ncbi:hypothetical protein [Bradyrhizobium canariense]|uniref:Uncharacterized protein n=1 Tax=Bradyrhizobium canariense TaxID=255045 RepID=A0A1X3GFK5_9BRAD|nr:hypothetical protein [Bradyrhizobium canariense]OSI70477.1 hypothetical protein BSZ22_14750 [Bradyrhizobium canariense]OSI75320.1 hypothetical protein BSZ23_29400 [Bradyrhizobium canariense]OSI85850.1 hypothetical protein BSZ25_31620 [Bradyrhizobium canariense]OSI88229.1 hypothetical protein BSZ24_24980 [Bradyrhizobium canariense]OSI99054.1 hypothetical protein BSZ16_30830 [Bradyrhizobium canariense]
MSVELIQKELSRRAEFWKKSLGWPQDNASYVFLGRAVHAMGKSMFGPEWTGDEPCRDVMRSLPVFPERSGWRAVLVHDLLVKHHPELNRQPRKPYQTSFEFTGNEWMSAVMLVKKHNDEQRPGFQRFSEVQDRIIQLAEAGFLITAIREKAGGDPTPIPRSWWNSERIRDRFDYCHLRPDDRYGIGIGSDPYQWIFVTRESLMSCAPGGLTEGEQGPTPIAATPAAAPLSEEPVKTPRRLAEAKIEPAFRHWREQQPEGYIPTEDEDIAHMKQLGVGRDKVRALRKNFPTRGRGEKKSG